MPTVLLVLSLGFALVALALALAGLAAFRRRRWLGGLGAGLVAALLLALAALAAVISVGVRGYRALTHEVIAATVRTEPIGPRQFRATVTLADGSLHMFDLSGDALYVDAHILKWHPLLNLLGLHTAYELDRIAGRYDDLAEERSGPRTVHSLARGKPVNAFDLARRYRILAPLVDAEYGSATFVEARQPAEFEVRVSTTGLLVRRVPEGG
ncbi:MAG TPA: hypothetical protein VNI61_04805 [Gemmatimonadales bacterium]|nr:hypothetical protein [Gemmatimonadales bacterium]